MADADQIGDYGDWVCRKVLIRGDDLVPADHSLAIGTWNGTWRTLAVRWDMRVEQLSRCGYPNAQGGRPRWFMLPDWMHVGTLAAADLSVEDRRFAIRFLQHAEN